MAKSYRPAGVGMIPAERGTFLIHAYFDDDQVDLVRSTVVGWQISGERMLTPLVVDPRAAEEDPWYVVHPDNRVECSDGRCWTDLDSWITEERRLRREALMPSYSQALKAAPRSEAGDSDAGAGPPPRVAAPPIPKEIEVPPEPKPAPPPVEAVSPYPAARRM